MNWGTMFLPWNPNARAKWTLFVLGVSLTIPQVNSGFFSVHSVWAASPYSKSELYSTEKGNEGKIRALRDEEIEQLRIALGRRLPANRQADIYFRLAEAYLEAYRSTFLLEGRAHEARLEKGMPDSIINRESSRPYLHRGIEACEEILKFKIRYEKMDSIYYFLGFYYGELNQQKDGIPYYNRLIAEFPKSPFLGVSHKEIGEFDYSNSQFRQALPHLEVAMSMARPDQVPAILKKIAWCHYRMKDFDQAISKMKDVVSRSNEDLKKFEPVKMQALKDLAVFLTERGRVNEALKYFEAESGDKAFYSKLLDKLGDQYADSVEYDQAELVYDTIIKTSEDSDSALKAFAKLVEIDIKKNRFDAVLNRIKSFPKFEAKGKDAQNALQNLRASFRKIAVDHHQSFRKKGTKNDLVTARQFYQAYLDHFLKFEDAHHEAPEIQMYLAEVYRDLGQQQEAVEMYRQVIASKDSRYSKQAAALWAGGLAELLKKSTAQAGAVEPSSLEKEFVTASDQLRTIQGDTVEGRETALRVAKVLAGYKSSRPEAVQRIQELIHRAPSSKEAVTAAQLWLQIYMDHPREETLPGSLGEVVSSIKSQPELLKADHQFNKGQIHATLEQQDLKSKVDHIAQQEKTQDFLGAGQSYEKFAAETQDRTIAEKAFTNAVNSYLKAPDTKAALSQVIEAWLHRYPASPKAVEPLRSIATHAIIVGDLDFSVSIFKKLGTEFKEAESLETAARVSQAMSQDQQAQALWVEHLTRYPSSARKPEIQLNLARSLEKSGSDGEASRSYRECAASGHYVAAECQARLADLYLKGQDVAKAKELYRELAGVSAPSKKGKGPKKKSTPTVQSPFVGYARYQLADLMEKEANFEPMKFPEAQLKKGLNQRLTFLAPLSQAYQGAVEVGGPWGIAALHRLALWATQFADEVDAIEAPSTLQGAALDRFKKQLLSVSQPLREKAKSTWSDAYAKAASGLLLSPVLPEIADRLADFKAGLPGRAQGSRGGFVLSGLPANGGTEGSVAALSRVRSGLLKDAKDAGLWLDYGNLFWGEGKPLLAKIAYQRSLALRSKNAAALNNLAVVLMVSEGEEDWIASSEAAASLEEALKVDDFFVAAKSNLASLMNYYRLFSRAKLLWDQVRVRHAGGAADFGLAVALQGLTQYGQAEALFQKSSGEMSYSSLVAYHQAAQESLKGAAGAEECGSLLRKMDENAFQGFEKNSVSYLMKRCESWRR